MKGIVFVNIHFAHGLSQSEYYSAINKLDAKVKSGLKSRGISLGSVLRVIFLGDFNDHSGAFVPTTSHKKSFRFLGKKLSMNGSKGIPKTCCWNHYPYKSDYIFDSENQNYFGNLKNMVYKNDKVLRSDHDPVISITN